MALSSPLPTTPTGRRPSSRIPPRRTARHGTLKNARYSTWNHQVETSPSISQMKPHAQDGHSESDESDDTDGDGSAHDDSDKENIPPLKIPAVKPQQSIAAYQKNTHLMVIPRNRTELNAVIKLYQTRRLVHKLRAHISMLKQDKKDLKRQLQNAQHKIRKSWL
ncbi:hypothetical protein CVT24_006775 [Panaeolus cyanescens]|uniref:Uncharacterized protein n=1 Tax=Panaeolus cyanescens TaxID=181874 RepID=A0A409VDR8_9AGAR|nr:hypothetical protein CVT24_006775 [Panaeolus cyanescens]